MDGCEMSRGRDSLLGKYVAQMGREKLSYLENRTTKACAEGVQTEIKNFKRVSDGFRNAEVYVRKVVLSFILIVLLLLSSYFLI